MKQLDEECDKNDLGGWDCSIAANAATGTLRCTSACKYDKSDCRTTCGYAQAFPFGNYVKYASGALTCNGCTLSKAACKPQPGCYWKLSMFGSLSVECIP